MECYELPEQCQYQGGRDAEIDDLMKPLKPLMSDDHHDAQHEERRFKPPTRPPTPPLSYVVV